MNAEREKRISNHPQSRDAMIVLWLLRACLVWFAIYIFLQGQDGFFAITIERVQSDWVKLTFLNVPLQLILTLFASFGLGHGRSPAVIRFALAIAILNVALIIGHIFLSIAKA